MTFTDNWHPIIWEIETFNIYPRLSKQSTFMIRFLKRLCLNFIWHITLVWYIYIASDNKASCLFTIAQWKLIYYIHILLILVKREYNLWNMINGLLSIELNWLLIPKSFSSEVVNILFYQGVSAVYISIIGENINSIFDRG